MEMPMDLGSDDFLADLMKEVQKTTEEALLKSKVVDLQKKIRDRRFSDEKKLELLSDLGEAQARLQVIMWRPLANVAFFTTQKCDGCGSEHSVFLQYMQRQETTSGAKVSRYQRVSRPHPELPNEVIKQVTETHVCVDCCEDHGFTMSAAVSKFQRNMLSDTRPFSVSSGYVQEEVA